jgi:vesicular inhibitory amino acid transporter
MMPSDNHSFEPTIENGEQCDDDALKTPSKIGSGGGHEGTSSTWGAAFNVLCTVVGTGLVQLPYGAAQSGWIGVTLVATMAAMACYTADLIVRCLRIMPTVSDLLPQTYGDIGEAAFGKAGKYFVTFQNHFTLVMVATIYNLLAGLNLVQLFPSWEWLTVEAAIVIVACVVWFHVFLKTLGEVAWVSALNLIFTLTLEVVVIVESVRNPPSEAPTLKFISKRPLALGGAFASFAFAYGVHPILPTVYRSMRSPKQYRKMIIATFVIALGIYLPMMCVGYAVYGDDVKSPIYTTPALSQSIAVEMAIALLTAHVIGAYPLVLNTPETELESALADKKRLPLLWRMCLRTSFVIITAAVAMLMKSSFPPFLDLVASISNTLSVYILPCVFYILLMWKAGLRLSAAEYMWQALIIVLATLGGVFGTIEAVQELVKDVF